MFLLVTFGYMDFLVIYKWLSDFTGEKSISAPSIINQMINLPLKAGSTDGTPLWDMESQETLQYYILIISLLAVPTMLLPKPLILLL
jgi:V-type H+-transporting ATPase subunit a